MKECDSGYGLVEGPVWHNGLGLLYSDVLNGGVFRLAKDGSVSQIVPKRRGIGGMALHANGGLVMGGRDVVVSNMDGTDMRVLLAGKDTPAGIGFNDLTTDQAGRIYVGCVGFRIFGGDEPKPGFLHVIDLDGSVRTISDGIWLTNGLGFSPDGKRFTTQMRGAMWCGPMMCWRMVRSALGVLLQRSKAARRRTAWR